MEDYEGNRINVGYDTPEGTLSNEIKVNYLESRLMDAKMTVLNLYEVIDADDITTKHYAQYLWGEEFLNKGREFHEGVDFNFGGDVRSIMSGEIVGIYYGSSSSTSPKYASALMVYDSDVDVTLIYNHLNISSALQVGDFIEKGETIGTQGRRGTKDQHTHLQVQEGLVSEFEDIYAQNPNLQSVDPYPYFWVWC